jgi:tetratricopeptide (TPR) repeat protein
MAIQAQEACSPTRLIGRLAEVALGYQRMLEENPRHPESLVGICLVALASGQHGAAVKMAQAAVAAAPELITTWTALGQALSAANLSDEAERAYDQAIRLDGTNALARMGLGELKIAAGRAGEAVREFELALRNQPALVSSRRSMCIGPSATR